MSTVLTGPLPFLIAFVIVDDPTPFFATTYHFGDNLWAGLLHRLVCPPLFCWSATYRLPNSPGPARPRVHLVMSLWLLSRQHVPFLAFIDSRSLWIVSFHGPLRTTFARLPVGPFLKTHRRCPASFRTSLPPASLCVLASLSSPSTDYPTRHFSWLDK